MNIYLHFWITFQFFSSLGSIQTTKSPESIDSPTLTAILETIPAHGEDIIVSIFIALRIATGSPFLTFYPNFFEISTIIPFIGEPIYPRTLESAFSLLAYPELFESLILSWISREYYVPFNS